LLNQPPQTLHNKFSGFGGCFDIVQSQAKLKVVWTTGF